MAALTPLLQTRNLSKRFGGILAVDSVDFSLSRNEIRAVIGPNGAGKTTLVSLISGRHIPSSGEITFEGKDITRLKPWTRATNGIVYTFQVTSIYKTLSCYENVALAVQKVVLSNPWSRLFGAEHKISKGVWAALEDAGFSGMSDRIAGELSYGHQRMLEVAMTLSLHPKLLILDEPTQGLAQAEIDELCTRVRRIAEKVTVLIIEHNMPVVLDLAETITVMDNGQIIAEGSPSEVENNPLVQEAYLGH